MKKFIFIIIFIAAFGTQLAFAQDSGGATLQYEMSSYTTNNKDASTPFFNLAFFNKQFFPIDSKDFTDSFQFLFDLIIGISIATAVIVFMYGAFSGILNSDNGKGEKDAKETMERAVVGLMIILSTWLIINTINPDLLRLPIFTGLGQLSQQNTSGGDPGNSVGNLQGN